MTRFYAEIENRRAVERLEKIGPKVRAALLDVVGLYKDSLVAAARARAPVKTGAYLASINAVVYGSKNAVLGVVRAGSHEAWYAYILEYGAALPVREIVDAKGVMAFEDGANTIFAKHIHFPGAAIKERDILTGPFNAMKPAIKAGIAAAAEAATAP